MRFNIVIEENDMENYPKEMIKRPIFTDYVQEDYSLDENGCIYSLNHKILYRAPLFMGDCIIPDGVESIYNEAFEFCDGLISVKMPDSMKCIGYQAFQYCKDLKIVYLNEGIEEVDVFAFYGCENLEQIIVPSGNLQHFLKMESLKEVEHLIIEK